MGAPEDVAAEAFAAGRPRDAAAEARAQAEVRRRLLGPPAAEDDQRYRLVRRVGVGGVGEVYEAWDQELQRRVALKVLRPTLQQDTSDTRARERLVREAQAIAQLSHPNVVSVFDVGTCTPAMAAILGESARGAVYLVMEYIEGPTLRVWLDREHRTLRAILQVFIAAARGLGAAHASGIVHRDFKPSNVVIGETSTRHGAADRVCVLDFGIARAVGYGEPSQRDGTAEPDHVVVLEELTNTGAVMGTPPYMAPEQHRGEPADPRTDQFAFGVALWEAVCGQRPYRGDTLAVLCAAKEHAPQKPPGVKMPRWLEHALRHAMAARPGDRHASMDALAATLERGSARKRRVIVGGVVVLAAGTFAAIGAGFGIATRSDACDGQRFASIWNDEVAADIDAAFVATDHPRTREVWTRARSGVEEYAHALTTAHARACEAAPNPRLAATLVCLDDRATALTAVTAVLANADATVVEHAVELVAELPSVTACDDPERPPALALAPERSHALLRARTMSLAGKIDEAESIAGEVEAEAEAAHDHASVARARILLGHVLLTRSGVRPEAAEAQFHAALVAAEKVGDHVAAIEALTMLVHTVGSVDARFHEAERFAELASAKLAHLGVEGDAAAALAFEIGLLRYRQYRNDDALAAFRSALSQREALWGTEHPKVARVRVEIGNVLTREERHDEARAEFERALGVYERVWGADNVALGGALGGLALLDQQAGDLAGAAQRLERVLALELSTHGAHHDSVAVASSNLGLLLLRLGEHTDALAAFDRALAIRLELFGPDHIAVARTRTNRGSVLGRLGRHAEAAAELGVAIDAFTEAMGAEHSTVGVALTNLATVQWAMDDRDSAIGTLVRAAEILESHGDVERSALAKALAQLGSFELVAGRTEAGRDHLERAMAVAPTPELARQIGEALEQAPPRENPG